MSANSTPLNEYLDALSASASSKGMTKLDGTMPGFGPNKGVESIDFSKWQVRILKVDLDDAGALAHLEDIETKSIRADGILVVSHDKFTFMDKMFVIVKYLEQMHVQS